MSKNTEKSSENFVKSPLAAFETLDEALEYDARTNTVQVTPWFATRTSSMVGGIPQKGIFSQRISHRLRWLLPIPLAGVAAVVLLSQHSIFFPAPAFKSSESEFEQHIEMFASSGDTQENYFLTTGISQ